MSSWNLEGGDWGNRRRWFENEDQYVRRQRAESEAASRAADARLRRSLDQVSKEKDALAREVARLGAAFDAFVELTEVRAELALSVAPEAVRRQVRELLGDLVQGGDVSSLKVDIVPGYWLSGAASGLSALVRGDATSAASAIAAASGYDERRTAVFLVLGLAVAGAGEKAEPWVLTALGAGGPEDEVSAGTRQVWRLAADGVLGPAGARTLREWLGETGYPADRLRGWLDERAARPARPVGTSAREHVIAQRAVETLEQLSQIYLSDTPPADALTPRQDELPPAAVLDGLIEEGSPEEMELIRRAADLATEVRTLRSAGDVPPATPRWDAPVGKLHALVEADLRASAAQRRAVAGAAVARSAAELADTLLDEASTTPSAVYRIDLEQQSLAIDITQPIDPQLAQVDAAIDQRSVPVPGARKKYNEELAQRAVERKAAARQKVRAGIAVLTEQNAKLPALRQSAEQTRTALLARLGQLAENNEV